MLFINLKVMNVVNIITVLLYCTLVYLTCGVRLGMLKRCSQHEVTTMNEVEELRNTIHWIQTAGRKAIFRERRRTPTINTSQELTNAREVTTSGRVSCFCLRPSVMLETLEASYKLLIRKRNRFSFRLEHTRYK